MAAHVGRWPPNDSVVVIDRHASPNAHMRGKLTTAGAAPRIHIIDREHLS
jgi:hypothetical protein